MQFKIMLRTIAIIFNSSLRPSVPVGNHLDTIPLALKLSVGLSYVLKHGYVLVRTKINWSQFLDVDQR